MSIKNKTLLTGIKPTGTPHVGNYLGAIQPALRLASAYDDAFIFIANYHALNTVQDRVRLDELTRSVAATWLACGLDPTKVIFYKQSSIPEVFELATILNSLTPKGWMNKAHAYKAAVDVNRAERKDSDEGVNMGLYTYPILMAADILLFDANVVPVGKDQVQHIEIARDIGQRFNHVYGTDILTLPEALIQEGLQSVPGLDGRKMSKSYDNVIPLFANRKQWQKAINKIPTDSTGLGEPKDADGSVLFSIYKSIADLKDAQEVRDLLQEGKMGWGELKERLLKELEGRFSEYGKTYQDLINNPAKIDEALALGAQKAHHIAAERMRQIRAVIS